MSPSRAPHAAPAKRAGFSLVEFDTFARHGLPVIAVIGNDAGWTQIRMAIAGIGLPGVCPHGPTLWYLHQS